MRPICNTLHGEVPTQLSAHFNILDIIEIEVTGYPEIRDYQSENVFFNENSIRALGKFNSSNLNQLCDNRHLIFGNKGKAVSEEAIETLTYSLMLLHLNQFEIIERTYDDNPGRPQVRLVFSYKGNQYNLPVTDPFFLHKYQINHDFMDAINELFVSVSLGVAWQNWYYKLVAGIIFQ